MSIIWDGRAIVCPDRVRLAPCGPDRANACAVVDGCYNPFDFLAPSLPATLTLALSGVLHCPGGSVRNTDVGTYGCPGVLCVSTQYSFPDPPGGAVLEFAACPFPCVFYESNLSRFVRWPVTVNCGAACPPGDCGGSGGPVYEYIEADLLLQVIACRADDEDGPAVDITVGAGFNARFGVIFAGSRRCRSLSDMLSIPNTLPPHECDPCGLPYSDESAYSGGTAAVSFSW